MNKSEFIDLIANEHRNFSKKEITQIFDAIISSIIEALAEGSRAEIRGLGSFSARRRKSRNARNPRTNALVELKERFTTYFRAGKYLNEALNSGK